MVLGVCMRFAQIYVDFVSLALEPGNWSPRAIRLLVGGSNVGLLVLPSSDELDLYETF